MHISTSLISLINSNYCYSQYSILMTLNVLRQFVEAICPLLLHSVNFCLVSLLLYKTTTWLMFQRLDFGLA